jgi:hypothetical protein
MAEQNPDEYPSARHSSKPSRRCDCEVCRVLRLSLRQLQFVTERHAIALAELPRFGASRGSTGSETRLVRSRKTA